MLLTVFMWELLGLQHEWKFSRLIFPLENNITLSIFFSAVTEQPTLLDVDPEEGSVGAIGSERVSQTHQWRKKYQNTLESICETVG